MSYVAYINKNIPIRGVKVQDTDYEEIGEGKYTVLGTYRKDSVDVKRIWSLSAEYLTKTQYDNIRNHLLGNYFGETDFWLDEFGGDATSNSVNAFIRITGDSRVQFSRNGVWHSDGRNIELEVREK